MKNQSKLMSLKETLAEVKKQKEPKDRYHTFCEKCEKEIETRESIHNDGLCMECSREEYMKAVYPKKTRKYGEEPIDEKAFTVEENPMPESRFAESRTHRGRKLNEEWRGHLQDQYTDLEEFLAYNETYNLSTRLGFDSAEEAWDANPVVKGSVNPEDYGLAGEDDFDEEEVHDDDYSEGTDLDEAPSIDEIESEGDLVDEYPVDESQTVSNAGSASVYAYLNHMWEIIEWNDNADEHESGSKTVSDMGLQYDESTGEHKKLNNMEESKMVRGRKLNEYGDYDEDEDFDEDEDEDFDEDDVEYVKSQMEDELTYYFEDHGSWDDVYDFIYNAGGWDFMIGKMKDLDYNLSSGEWDEVREHGKNFLESKRKSIKESLRNSKHKLNEAMEVDEHGKLIEKEDSVDDKIKEASISELARMIRRDWKKVYFGAEPYLKAMSSLETVNDSYGMDNGRMVVNYFLSNASQWKGELAKKIKAELKKRVSGKSRKNESISHAEKKLTETKFQFLYGTDGYKKGDIIEADVVGENSLEWKLRILNTNDVIEIMKDDVKMLRTEQKEVNQTTTGDTAMNKTDFRDKLLERLKKTTEGRKLLREMKSQNLNEGLYDEYSQSLADEIEDAEDNRRFVNYYKCPDCECNWQDDNCDSMHNDHCPDCDHEIEPYKSEELDADGNVIDHITHVDDVESYRDSEVDESCEGMDECGGVQMESRNRRGRKLNENRTGAALRSGVPIIGGVDYRSNPSKMGKRYEVSDEMLGSVHDQYGGIRLTNDDIFAENSYERNMSAHVGDVFDDEDFVIDMNRLRKPKPASSSRPTPQKPLNEAKFEGFRREEETSEEEFDADMDRYYIDGYDPDGKEDEVIDGPGEHTEFDSDEFEEFESGVERAMGHINRGRKKPEVRKLRPEKDRNYKFKHRD